MARHKQASKQTEPAISRLNRQLRPERTQSRLARIGSGGGGGGGCVWQLAAAIQGELFGLGGRLAAVKSRKVKLNPKRS